MTPGNTQMSITDELYDTYVIRPSKEEDAANIERLFQVHLNWISVWFQDVVKASRTPSLTTWCFKNFPGAVAYIDEQMVGFANCRLNDAQFIDLINIYVDDMFRRRGIGTALCRCIEEQAAQMGVRTIMATASTQWFPGKPSARGLFEKLGYTVSNLASDTQMYHKELEIDLTSTTER